MDLLVIDTSTERSQVIFAQNPSSFETIQLPIGLAGSQGLFAAIASFAKRPQAVAVTVGPGSYTGIRVGMSAAKGISSGGDLPLVGLCALSGFISSEEECFLSLIDARGGGAYIMTQQRKGNKIISITSAMRCPLEELPMHLHGVKKVVGPQLARFDLLRCETCYADPAYLVQRAYRKLQEGVQDSLVANYLDV